MSDSNNSFLEDTDLQFPKECSITLKADKVLPLEWTVQIDDMEIKDVYTALYSLDRTETSFLIRIENYIL